MCGLIGLRLTTPYVLPNVAVTADALEQGIDLGHRELDYPPGPKFPKLVYTYLLDGSCSFTMATCAVIDTITDKSTVCLTLCSYLS